MFFRQKKAEKYTYLQVVENHWNNGKVRQETIKNFGRLDQIRKAGQLDSLLASGARFTESALVLTAHKRGETTSVRNVKIGPDLLFNRLWKEDGLPGLLNRFLEGRRFGFPVERAVRELDEITITEISHDNKGRQLRSEVPACAGLSACVHAQAGTADRRKRGERVIT